MGDDRAVRFQRLTFALIWLALLMMRCETLRAQTTEAEISARLVGKPLYLRGFWTGEKLRFDGNGVPAKGYPAAPFTASGVDVDQVQLRGDTLRLDGVRVVLGFKDNPVGDRFEMDRSRGPGRPADLEPVKVEIEIKGTRGRDFGKALQAVFATNLADLMPSLPECWRWYAGQHFVPQAATAAPVERRQPPVAGGRVGGRVSQPRLLKSVDPEFSEYARVLKVSGNVLVHLVVGTDGLPRHVEVRRPVGFGLDEKAVEAVQQYRFEPAVKDGQAVPVELAVDVNFQIF